MTVACVLRRGGEYTPYHVRKLYEQVRFWWCNDQPLRFVALTDTPICCAGVEERPLLNKWSGWWAKMELFGTAQDDLGSILYFDLDTMIVGPLDTIPNTTGLTLLEDFYHHHLVQSGMMLLPPWARAEARMVWEEDPIDVVKRWHGDGQFLDSLWRTEADRWQEAHPGQVVSYKAHVRRNVAPDSTRVVCFHGQPRPWETPLWSLVA